MTAPDAALAPYLKLIARGETLSRAEMGAAMTAILEGRADSIAIAGFLMGLRARGETVDEIVAAAETMRAMATPVDLPPGAVDTCGTGGDGADTFNISTAAALIAAGAGVRVAKHGNRAVSSKSGSSDVLAALGVNLDASPETVARCVTKAGVGFMFAPMHHAAVAHAAPIRKALGVRTIFNLLGPLANPGGATRQVMGVFDAAYVEPLARALGALGAAHAWVVHGSDGLDELTTTGPSRVAEWKAGALRVFDVTPEDAGLPRATAGALHGGDPTANAAGIERVLGGEKGPWRDIAVFNAAAALIVAGQADDLAVAARRAEAAIDSGAATRALAGLVAISNGRAP